MLYDLMNDYDEMGKAFIKAANYVEEHGLHKGGYQHPFNGSVCSLGALNISLTGVPTFGNQDKSTNSLSIECEREMVSYVTDRYSSNFGVVGWNDCHERTVEDVIGMFRELASHHKLVKVA